MEPNFKAAFLGLYNSVNNAFFKHDINGTFLYHSFFLKQEIIFLKNVLFLFQEILSTN